MKKISFFVLLLLLLSSVYAALPDLNALGQQAEAAAKSAAELTALKTMVQNITPVQFKVNSSSLELSDPNYKIAGYDVDSLMKSVIIPAISDIVNKLPTDKKLAIIGHANKTGTEEATDTFVGNTTLSMKRAESVLNYIVANSSLSKDTFSLIAAGSTQSLSGVDASSDKNCRVAFDIK